MRCRFFVALLMHLGCPLLYADDPPPPDTAQVREAIVRGLKIVETGARNYPNHRKCFSCHHQTLPLLAMSAAGDAGVAVNEELFNAQVEFTRKSLKGRIDSLREGTGIGGRAMTVGYALWTLDIAGSPRDELSEAMVTYLLKQQEEGGDWRPPSNRPPLEESALMCTVLAAYGLERFAGDDQRDSTTKARASARAWLKSAIPRSQEDFNARLWGLWLSQADDDERNAATRAILDAQGEDGGWGQIAEMPSDAYATGQTLFLLAETGHATSSAVFQKGIRFLLSSQRDDGSWHVPTRSKPVQVYFDNGDPHGKDQFISMAATSWAVAAMARSLKGGHARDVAPNGSR